MRLKKIQERLKGGKFELFHRVLAVALTLFMVVSILPTFGSEAATTYVRHYTIDNGTYLEDGYGTAKNMSTTDTFPRNSTAGAGFTAGWYMMKKDGTKIGYIINRDDVNSERKKFAKAVTGAGNTRETYAYAYGVSKVNFQFRYPNDGGSGAGSIGFQSGPISPEVTGVNSPWANTTGVTCKISIPSSTFKRPGGVIAGRHLSTLSTDSFRFAGGSSPITWTTLPDDYLTAGTVTVWGYLISETFSSTGTSWSAVHAVRTHNLQNPTNIFLTADFAPAPTNYITYHSNYPVKTATNTTKKSPGAMGDGLATAAVSGNDYAGFSVPHYEFDGWKDKDGKAVAVGTSFNMATNYDLYAQWKRSGFQISYDANGANTKYDGYDNVPSDDTWYKDGQKATVLPGDTAEAPLKKDQMLFDGWNTKADGTGTSYQADDEIAITKSITDNITLYAQWKNAPIHHVEYTNGGEDGDAVTRPVWDDGIAENRRVILEKNSDKNSSKFTSTRYTFLTWKRILDDKRYAPDHFFDFDLGHKSEEVQAVWGTAVTYDDNGSTVGSVPVDSTVYEIDALAKTKGNEGVNSKKEPDPLKKSGHIFTGWDKTDGMPSDAKTDFHPGDPVKLPVNTTLFAHWQKAKEYEVTYDKNLPHGVKDSDLKGSMPTDSSVYYNDELNDTITLKSNTAKLPGYRFAYWLDENDKKVYPGKDYKIGKDTSQALVFRACWETAREYKVTYDANPPKGAKAMKGTLPKTKSYYNDGINDVFTVEKPDTFSIEGQRFKYWSTTKTEEKDTVHYKGDGTENVSVFTFNKDVTLYAQWDTELAITGIEYNDKSYDGSKDWSGKIDFTGKRPGEKISISNSGGDYSDGNVGSDKKLVINDLKINAENAGDADHYYIKDGAHMIIDQNGKPAKVGEFDSAKNTFNTFGRIKKKEITVTPVANPSYIIKGDAVPSYSVAVTKGSLASGDNLGSLGTPSFTCELTKDGKTIPLTQGSVESTDYVLSASGLSSNNYDITMKTAKVTVQLPGSTQAKVTYHANLPASEFTDGWAAGSVPTDGNTYFTYNNSKYQNSQVTVLENTTLTRSGYQFLGWDTNASATSPAYPAGGKANQFTIQGNTDLYAIWKGNTKLTVTGITNKTKAYDGTDKWVGNVTLSGAVAGRDVSVKCTSAAYDTKDAGTSKTITLKGVYLDGTGKDMYYLADGGMYNKSAGTIAINTAAITPKAIGVTINATPASFNEGSALPAYQAALASGSALESGDYLSDLGTPVITCKDSSGNDYTINSPAGEYTLSISGFTNPNYTYTYTDKAVKVIGIDGKTPVKVTYNGNGADGGTLPPAAAYFTYTDTTKNDTVTIPASEPSLTGCKFAGWSTSPNGGGTIYKNGGANSQFTIMADTTLYAVWEADTELTINGVLSGAKVYDNSAAWSGSLKLGGVIPGTDVKATFSNGTYDSKDAGNRTITADGIHLTGKDAFRYILKDGGANIYNETTKAISAQGVIFPRNITMEAYVSSGNPAMVGNTVPTFAYKIADGSLADGETINDLLPAAPAELTYTIKDAEGNEVNWGNIQEAAGFSLGVSGFENDNYNILYKSGLLSTADQHKSTVRMVYHNNPAAGIIGTPPVDKTDYFIYTDTTKAKDTPTLKDADKLSKHGYKFKEWNTKKDGTGESYQAGTKDLVVEAKLVTNGEIHLWPVFEGDTKLTVKALSDTTKVYDGTNAWSGTLILEGLEEGDDVTAAYTSGRYSDESTGDGKVVNVKGISFSGADLDKYVIEKSDIYDPDESEAADPNGKINPRELEVLPTATPDVLNIGEELPSYGLYLPAQSKIVNPDQLGDFGEPEFQCKNIRTGEDLSETSEIGDYGLNVSGLTHQNYDIKTGSARVRVTAPGMKEAHVTYHANSNEISGVIPVDSYTYYTCDDPDRNSTVMVLENTMKRNGYHFLGWSMSQDGSGMRYQMGDTFRIQGDTVLYAVWEQNPVKGNDKSETEKPGKPGTSESTENGGISAVSVTDDNSRNFGTAGISSADSRKAASKGGDGYSFKVKGTKFKGNLNNSSLTSFTDEKVPLGASPFGGSSHESRWFNGTYGSIADCMMHWIILLGILLTVCYDAFRIRTAKSGRRENASFLFDRVLTIAPIPAVLLLFFMRHCLLDLWLLVTWIIVMEIGRYFISQYYKQKAEQEFAE